MWGMRGYRISTWALGRGHDLVELVSASSGTGKHASGGRAMQEGVMVYRTARGVPSSSCPRLALPSCQCCQCCRSTRTDFYYAVAFVSPLILSVW